MAKDQKPQYKTNANELARTLLTERENVLRRYGAFQGSRCAAWCKIRSVLNPKLAPYNYPTLVSRDEGGIKTRSVTTTEKLETFASQLEGVFTNEIEDNVFEEEVKTDVDAEVDQPIARARLNFQVIPFHPDIHPDRIRFGELTDTLPHSYTSHHSPGLAQHLPLPRLSP